MSLTVAGAVHDHHAAHDPHDGHPAHEFHEQGAPAGHAAARSSLRPGVSPLWWSVPRRLAGAVALIALLWLVIAWAVV